ncbi:MAG TPA: cytochrome C biogenesis protein CcdA [Nitrospiraceae bacterium]|nr:cytochrome C biogenesis protein CcdA [Nitrospiraceae bacterium]
MADEIVLFITAGSDDEAATIARTLVNEHLVACANIISGVRSVFFWEGATQDEPEALIVLKSRLPLMDKIIPRVKELHSYSEPEVIALPIVSGSRSYLDWIGEVTRKAE